MKAVSMIFLTLCVNPQLPQHFYLQMKVKNGVQAPLPGRGYRETTKGHSALPPKWATVMSNQQWSCLAIGEHHTGPLPKWAAVTEWPLVGQWLGSGVLQVETEARGRSQPSEGAVSSPVHQPAGELGGPAAQGTGWGLCPGGLQSPGQGRPLAGPSPWGGSDLLLSLRPNGSGISHRLHESQTVGPDCPPILATWGAWGLAGPWAPGSLSEDG